MYDINKIKLYAVTKAVHQGIDVDSVLIDYEIDRAIAYGSMLRNCTPAYLLEETKDYTTVLVEMVVSALMLADKLGRMGYTENGITNNFEDGNIYQKEQTKMFIPLIKGL